MLDNPNPDGATARISLQRESKLPPGRSIVMVIVEVQMPPLNSGTKKHVVVFLDLAFCFTQFISPFLPSTVGLPLAHSTPIFQPSLSLSLSPSSVFPLTPPTECNSSCYPILACSKPSHLVAVAEAVVAPPEAVVVVDPRPVEVEAPPTRRLPRLIFSGRVTYSEAP